MACSMLGQLAWLAAILVKEMPTAGCTSVTSAAMPGSFPCLPAGMQLETPRALTQVTTGGGPPAAACPGGLERVSAPRLDALAMWRMSDVNT